MRRPALLGAAVALALLAGGTGVAVAAFSAAATADLPVSSATLQPPTGVTATDIDCASSLSSTTRVAVGWTASPSSFVTSYVVDRVSPSPGQVGTVAAGGALSVTDTSRPLSTLHTYTVTAVRGSGWSTTSSSATVTTRSSCL